MFFNKKEWVTLAVLLLLVLYLMIDTGLLSRRRVCDPTSFYYKHFSVY